MAVLLHTRLQHHRLPSPFLSSAAPSRTRSRVPIPVSPFFSMMNSSSSSFNPNLLKQNWQDRLLEFPHLSPSHRKLMLQLISAVDSRLGSQLLPSSLPPDVAFFQNSTAASQGAIDIRSGHPSNSKVDFILASWLHSSLPTGAALDITTIFAFLNATTDAPHLSLELIRSGPSSLILLLDLLPRQDLVLHPDYLESFYEKTQLDKLRQKLEQVAAPALQPYISSSLYIRSVLSPTAIAVRVESKELDELLGGGVGGVVEEVVRLWLEECGCSEREVGEMEREIMVRRDYFIKTKAVEVDLTANLPRLFGPDVSGRVVEEIQKAFGVAAR